jgi:hypothetical protein
MGISLDTFMFQLILVAFSGSLLGEAVREVNNNTPISFSHFIVEFMAGGFMALMIAIVLKVMVIKDEPVLVLPFTGFMAFAGRKQSAALAERILTTMLSKGGAINDNIKPISTDDKTEGTNSE